MDEDRTGEATTKYPIGSIAPRVPYLTPRTPLDRGPAGLLVQARDRERTQRLATRGPATRDRRVWSGAVLGVLSVIALVVGVRMAVNGAGSLISSLLVFVAASGVIGAASIVITRYAPGTVEVELNSQIHRERRTARQLEVLISSGWTVLHDRLAPGGEHRLAHVLAGPAGVVVATEIPAHGPPTARSRSAGPTCSPAGWYWATGCAPGGGK